MLYRIPPVALTETSPAGALEWTARSGLDREGGIEAALPVFVVKCLQESNAA
jgi:hypothetical protein